MTVQLEWPQEVVDRISEEARRKGLSLDAYLLEAALRQSASERSSKDELERSRRREEAGRSIRELRKGNVLGPHLTIGDLRRGAAVLSSFVIDNSVTAAWCFEDQGTPYTEAVLQAAMDGASLFVPAIWRLEVVSVLVVAERRRKIAVEKSVKFLDDLEQLSFVVDNDGLERVFSDVLHQARRYQRSAYDASYLELARRRRLPLATKDEPLRKAAEELGVAILQF